MYEVKKASKFWVSGIYLYNKYNYKWWRLFCFYQGIITFQEYIEISIFYSRLPLQCRLRGRGYEELEREVMDRIRGNKGRDEREEGRRRGRKCKKKWEGGKLMKIALAGYEKEIARQRVGGKGKERERGGGGGKRPAPCPPTHFSHDLVFHVRNTGQKLLPQFTLGDLDTIFP